MRVWCPVTSEAVVKDVVKGGNKKEKLICDFINTFNDE